MVDEIKLKHNLYGYNTIVKDRYENIRLKGDRISELDMGMEVALLADSSGYVPSNSKPGENIKIFQFTEPFSCFPQFGVPEETVRLRIE